MKAPRSVRLVPLRQHAQRREEAARHELAEAQRVSDQKEGQRRELEAYLAEYLKAFAPSTTTSQLVNRQAFVARLREALAFQQRAATQAAAAAEARRGQWLQRNQELDRLERLRQRYLKDEHRLAESRNQKHLDEFATRRFLARPEEQS